MGAPAHRSVSAHRHAPRGTAGSVPGRRCWQSCSFVLFVNRSQSIKCQISLKSYQKPTLVRRVTWRKKLIRVVVVEWSCGKQPREPSFAAPAHKMHLFVPREWASNGGPLHFFYYSNKLTNKNKKLMGLSSHATTLQLIANAVVQTAVLGLAGLS